jgi:putative GTP pyrophosphokinase
MSPRAAGAAKDPDLVLISSIVRQFKSDLALIRTMLDQLVSSVQSSDPLMLYVHSLRWRVKDPDHLRDKLLRKLKRAQEENIPFDVTIENYREKINDLAGLRILHLHTSQIVGIDKELSAVLKQFSYSVIESAKARTWDDEYRSYYESVGIGTTSTPNKMYTSVHYVVSPQITSKLTCEIQVRTLAEELWGEVDHAMNYPLASKVAACREQIKVLARVTSSCSRLVDSIYESAKEHKSSATKHHPKKAG